MVSGDDSQFDGLWNRFSFVGLPQFKTSAFTETPADLGIELDKVYRALSEQPHQTHWLSIESKPLWEAWHDEIEDKVLSGSTGLVKGTYAKFHGIAGRNALILHRTLAAINKIEPEQLISAAVMELAIAWTKWELSQTLLQYQLLGLTNDPELSRILKFIDKFTGKGWVKPVEVRGWWSVKPKPSFDELKKFMAKVVSLGCAIDNDEPNASSKYQIKILEKSSQSSHSSPETQTQHIIQERLLIVTDSLNGLDILSQGKGLNVVTTDSHESSHSFPESNAKRTAKAVEKDISDDPIKTVTTNGHESSHNPKHRVNSHHSDSSLESVTSNSHSVNTIPSSKYSDVVTTLTTFPKSSDFKIGDRANLGNEIFTIDRIESDFIGGTSDDGSYIGGHINNDQPVNVDRVPIPLTPNGYTTKETGNGFIEIVSNRSQSSHNTAGTIDDEGIEYEC